MNEYQEIAASSDLREYVDCFWFRRSATASESSHLILPDGCMDIILNFGEPRDGNIQPRNRDRAYVVGAMTRPISVPAQGREDMFGVRFRPGMAFHILQLPAGDLTDTRVSLADIFKSEASTFIDQLFDRQPQERVAVVEQSLKRRIAKALPADRRAKFVVDSISQSAGKISIAEMCSAAGVSRQHLARLFQLYVGVSPKLLCRIFRFQSVLREIGTQTNVDWADAAAKLGYYDQPHLILDFKEFSGKTPSEYFRPA